MAKVPKLNTKKQRRPVRYGTTLGALVLGGIVMADASSQLLFWRRNQTEVIVASGAEPRWLAVPGLGQSTGQFIHDTLAGGVPGTIDYLQLSSRGISAKKVGRALAHYYRRYFADGQAQRVMVHSLGLPTFLMGVEWCREHSIAVPPLGVLLAFSSPLNPAHTFHETFIRRMRRMPYPGGVFSKFGVEFYQRYYGSKFRLAALSQAAAGAFKKAYRDCAPALWASQIRTLAHRDLYPEAVFANIITPETHIVHFGDPNDSIVNVPAARRDFANFVQRYGADLTVVEMPGQGHANMRGIRRRLPDLAIS